MCDRTRAGAGSRLRAYVALSRPFTLIPPAVGIITGALSAHGARGVPIAVHNVLYAAVAAAMLNVASNALNQICDLQIDRINKPMRPLPAGKISIRQAWAFTAISYAIAISLVSQVNLSTLAVYVLGALLTVAYSAPPLRLRRYLLLSNVTIGATRGLLLKVAGWAVLASIIDDPEPWLLGSIFFLYVLGAASTKDFSDMAGDREAGCLTLPMRFGLQTSAKMILPFFTLPWLLFPLASWLGFLSADFVASAIVGVALSLWGAIVGAKVLHGAADLALDGENHPAWRHMYLLMIMAHVGTAAAYLYS